jgi:antitoxin MazE
VIKKLVAHGNSAALIIDKPILELLKIEPGTPLELTTDGRSLIISPVGTAARGRRPRATLKKINKVHGKTLEKLAR